MAANTRSVVDFANRFGGPATSLIIDIPTPKLKRQIPTLSAIISIFHKFGIFCNWDNVFQIVPL